ncbi:hypothetical protein MASR1M48_17250 [Lactococcus petauri]
MIEQRDGVNGGKASPKPTKEQIEAKRQEILERIRNQAADIDISENPIKPVVSEIAAPAKKYRNEKFTCPEEITDRNHTFRERRMTRLFGLDQVNNLKEACKDPKDYKWELYRAEEMGVMETRVASKPYNPKESDHQGASPIEVKWMGQIYYIDRQSSFKVEYCDQLISYMKFGRSLRSFAGHINVTSDTFYGWMKRYKILQDAADIAYGKGLEIIETLCFFAGAGMNEKEMSDKFGVNRMNYKMLQFVAKSKFREDFFEKVNIDYGDAKNLAELEGPELQKKVAEIKERYNRLTGQNPITDFNLYKGED